MSLAYGAWCGLGGLPQSWTAVVAITTVLVFRGHLLMSATISRPLWRSMWRICSISLTVKVTTLPIVQQTILLKGYQDLFRTDERAWEVKHLPEKPYSSCCSITHFTAQSHAQAFTVYWPPVIGNANIGRLFSRFFRLCTVFSSTEVLKSTTHINIFIASFNRTTTLAKFETKGRNKMQRGKNYISSIWLVLYFTSRTAVLVHSYGSISPSCTTRKSWLNLCAKNYHFFNSTVTPTPEAVSIGFASEPFGVWSSFEKRRISTRYNIADGQYTGDKMTSLLVEMSSMGFLINGHSHKLKEFV